MTSVSWNWAAAAAEPSVSVQVVGPTETAALPQGNALSRQVLGTALLRLIGVRHADSGASAKDQIAKASSSNATATRRFADTSTPNS